LRTLRNQALHRRGCGVRHRRCRRRNGASNTTRVRATTISAVQGSFQAAGARRAPAESGLMDDQVARRPSFRTKWSAGELQRPATGAGRPVAHATQSPSTD
jgi:hypothetical protein